MSASARSRRLAAAAVVLLLASACVTSPAPAQRSPVTPQGSVAGPARPAPNARSGVGINLSWNTYFNSQIPFVDVFKSASPWIVQKVVFSDPLDTKLPIALGPDGWPASLLPNQAAMALMLNEIEGHYPAGDYVCLYEGDGTITFRNDAKVTAHTPGRIVATVAQPTKQGIRLDVTKTNPADPIRNIRVILPGFEATYATRPFHPRFLEELRPFKVVRFLQWQRIGDAPIDRDEAWADRVTPRWYTQASDRGVALELAASLVNELAADAWLHVPARATDDYARQLATFARDSIGPAQKVYVEYSNEVWNSGFRVSRYARERGTALGLGGTPYDTQIRFYSRRSVEIFKIFEQVFAGTSRLVRVLAWQHADVTNTKQVIEYEKAYEHADALAVAPYFGYEVGDPRNRARTQTMTVEQILDAAHDSIVRLREITKKHLETAKARGLQLVAYESGQSIVGAGESEGDATLTALFTAANRSPRMTDLYLEDLAGWRDIGGGLINAYSATLPFNKFGSWGLREWQDQDLDAVPKSSAVREFIAKSPRWW